MNFKRVSAAAAIAVGVGMSLSTGGMALVSAAPSDPPPGVPVVQPDPGGPAPGLPAEKCWRYGRSGGGNPRGGGGVPGFLPPCAGRS
ncbi:hypothetical protein [Mycobacterium sp.]|uniref:hypothetical protein n=1 Tax=Mycobacterium sp. TaxID=1785 RepID=UPI003D0A0855